MEKHNIFIVFFLWASLILAKKFGSKIGFVSILLAPVYYLYLSWYLVTVINNYSWVYIIIFFILLTVIQGVLLSIQQIENGILQASRDTHAYELGQRFYSRVKSNLDIPAFSIYLRPFSSTNMLHTQVANTAAGVNDDFGTGSLDLEFLLTVAAKDIPPLIAFGKPGEMTGVGRIENTEEDWKEMIIELLKSARYIFILPSHQEGTLWEIKKIQEFGLFDKCIWIMPENIQQGGFYSRLSGGIPKIYNEYAYMDFSGNWEKTAEKLKELNIELPDYSNEGMLFKMSREGRLSTFENLNLKKIFNKAGRIKKIIRLLLPG